MKHIIYILALLAMSGLEANAQRDPFAPEQKSSFGIFGGINFQNINGKDAAGMELSNSLVPRFNIGINYDISVAPEFYIQPGLQFITKGTKGPMPYTQNSETHIVTREIKLSYLEMPVNFVFKPALGNGQMILAFGPYFSYGLNGKATFEGGNVPQDSDIEFVKSVPSNDMNNLIYFKRMDMGANFSVGYEMANGVNILFNAQLGMANINATTTTKMVNKNTGFGLALGYRFL